MIRVSKASLLAILLLLALAAGASGQGGQAWFERARLAGAYDLKGTRILVVAAADFNYGETVEMAECWKRWGARVEFAGPARVLAGEREGASPGAPLTAAAPTLRVDRMLEEVDPGSVDVLYFAGGEGVGRLLADHRGQLRRVVDAVHARGGIVSAICHGPEALAASSVVKGRRVTVQGAAARRALEDAGAVVVGDVVVVDGRIVTGQWPHLEEFAVVLAERVRFPAGGGPRERALASRTSAERHVDDLRQTYAFDSGKPVPASAIETLVRAAQRTLAPRRSGAGEAMRFVVVRDPAAKAELAGLLAERAQPSLVAMGMPEALVRSQVGRMIEGAPVLLFQFVEAPAAVPGQVPAPALRTGIAFAGAAAANLALVARSVGLGIVMLGIEPFLACEDVIRQHLRVPENQMLVGWLGIGYGAAAASGTPAVARPAAEIAFAEHWEGPANRR